MPERTLMTERATPRGSVPAVRGVAVAACVLTAAAGAAGAMSLPYMVPERAAAFFAAPAAQVRPGSAGFADVVKAVKPAVFAIRVKVLTGEAAAPVERLTRNGTPGVPSRGGGRFVVSQGSGFFVSADGYAVTNYHVIKNNRTAEVVTDDNKTYPVKVVGVDPTSDLALLKVDGRDDFTFVEFSDAPPRIGDWIVAVGNPYGLGGTVTAGIVSAHGRDLNDAHEDLIQIDAPINQGNSGGPTFDLDGRVIGINTMIFSPTGGSVGIAFGIPAARAKAVLAQLKDKGAVHRGWLGAGVQAVSPEIGDSLGLGKAAGVIVTDIIPDAPADEAGIVAGDLIHAVNARVVNDPHDFTRAFEDIAPGTLVVVTLTRNGEDKTMTAVAGRLPGADPVADDGAIAASQESTIAADPSQLGLTLLPAGMTSSAGDQGVVVTDVDPNSAAAGRIGTGDVILDVAQRAVAAPEDVYRAVAHARIAGKPSVLMRVKSGKKIQFVAIPVG